jgi:hypothetical protein
MPFEVGNTINQFTKKITSINAVNVTLKNPFYIALLIIFIVVLIILYVFRDVDSDESLLTLSLRVGIPALMLTTGIMILHNKLMTSELKNEEKDSDLKHIFTGSHSSDIQGVVDDALVPVKIDTNFD